jgi:hypothetical protein
MEVPPMAANAAGAKEDMSNAGGLSLLMLRRPAQLRTNASLVGNRRFQGGKKEKVTANRRDNGPSLLRHRFQGPFVLGGHCIAAHEINCREEGRIAGRIKLRV